MEAIQYREMLDIVMAPAMQLIYYKQIRARYNAIIHENALKKPPKPPEMYLAADGKEAKEALFSVFRSLKRGMGYGSK